MKKLVILLAAIVFAGSGVQAQLKSQETSHVSAAQSLIRPAPSLPGLLSWFNPDNFLMKHSLSFQYVSSGGRGLSLAMYTNSMFYRIADPLDVRFDLSLMGSPFGQYGTAQQSDFSNIFLSRAELNYRPFDNMLIRFQYQQIPFGAYGWYAPYYYRSTPFGD